MSLQDVEWQAEALLSEAAQDVASAPNADALLRVQIAVQMAQAYATLAVAKSQARA